MGFQAVFLAGLEMVGGAGPSNIRICHAAYQIKTWAILAMGDWIVQVCGNTGLARLETESYFIIYR